MKKINFYVMTLLFFGCLIRPVDDPESEIPTEVLLKNEKTLFDIEFDDWKFDLKCTEYEHERTEVALFLRGISDAVKELNTLSEDTGWLKVPSFSSKNEPLFGKIEKGPDSDED